jgi:hypothetical protein
MPGWLIFIIGAGLGAFLVIMVALFSSRGDDP